MASLEVSDEIKEDGFHYRWARRDANRLRLLKRQGYEIVQVSGEESEENPHGAYVYGSLVLTRCPEETYQKRKLQRNRDAAELEDGVAQRFQEQAGREGVDTRDDSASQARSGMFNRSNDNPNDEEDE